MPTLPFIKRYWKWIALVCTIILVFPLFTPAGYFFWGLGSTKDFFHNNIGIGESLSTTFAVAFMFIYTLAMPFAARWLAFGRKNPKGVAVAFVSVLFVFGSKPLLMGVLGSRFNASTGEAQKCYSWSNATLAITERGSSGCGVDPATGQKTAELTPEIAGILARQQRPPRPIAIDGSPIQFFDPATGRAIVWYDRAPDGRPELFDADGFNPNNGNRLKAATPDIVAMIHNEIDKLKLDADQRGSVQIVAAAATSDDSGRKRVLDRTPTTQFEPPEQGSSGSDSTLGKARPLPFSNSPSTGQIQSKSDKSDVDMLSFEERPTQ